MRSKEIAQLLGLEHIGEDIEISGYSTPRTMKENTLLFTKERKYLEEIVKNKIKNIAVITRKEWIGTAEGITYLASENPRLDFIKALLLLYPQKKVVGKNIHPTAIIDKSVKIGENCWIGPFVYIGENTVIGDNVYIHPHVVIYGNTKIGNNVIIHSGTVIGKPGFGYEKDKDGTWIRFPQMGGVIIEDNVEIGANTVVDCGALEDTIIGVGTKIDNLVHVAHGVKIGKNCIIVACVQTGGSDQIGDNTWIGPNTSMLEGIKVGRNCMVGAGAVVTKDIPDNTTVTGNPAMEINEFKKMREKIKSLQF